MKHQAGGVAARLLVQSLPAAIGPAATITALALLAATAMSAPVRMKGNATRASPVSVTSKGIGDVELRSRYSALRAERLLGRLQPSCSFGRSRRASLRNGADGFAFVTNSRPRRVKGVVADGNAQASGVAIGDSLREVRRAFPNAAFHRGLVRVPDKQGGPLSFALSGKPKRVTAIGAPDIAYCE